MSVILNIYIPVEGTTISYIEEILKNYKNEFDLIDNVFIHIQGALSIKMEPKYGKTLIENINGLKNKVPFLSNCIITITV